MQRTIEQLRAQFASPGLRAWRPTKIAERPASGFGRLIGRKVNVEETDDAWKPIYLDFIPHLVVHGAEAVAEWQRLRTLAEGTGYWPIICGGDIDANHLFSALADADFAPKSPDECLRESKDVKPPDFLRARVEVNNADPEWHASVHGDWPKDVPLQGLVLPNEIRTGQPKEKVILALVPATATWEVPASLSYGGWNECPYPHEHVAVLRYWHEHYGAEVVGMTGDIIEMQAKRRPAARDDAMRLAEEQFAYCEDIVTQGLGTVENLAAVLIAQDNWYFWWD